MKTKDELQVIAKKAFFDKMPDVKFMYATADGNFFHKDHFNAANAQANGGNLYLLHRDAKKSGNVDELNKQKKQAEDKKQQPKEYAKSTKVISSELKAVKTPEELLKYGVDNHIENDERSTVMKAWKKSLNEIGLPVVEKTSKTAVGSEDPKTAEEFIKLIEEVKTETDFDALEAKFGLSKHESAEVVSAYEKKESEFLD